MSNNEFRKRKPFHKRPSTWIVVGVIILIVLLFLWVDVADIAGAGDGGNGYTEAVEESME